MDCKQRRDPLIVYIHIPKTAGSTVNRMLNDWDSNGQAHCHAMMTETPDAFKAILNSATWVSGHFGRGWEDAQFGRLTDRRLRLFTMLRYPTAQIASHYNWLIEIYHKSPQFYDKHPEEIKDISRRIRETDNTDPREIIKRISEYRGLFLNMQSRYVFGPKHKTTPEDVKAAKLMDYECISIESELSGLLRKMTGVNAAERRFENKSNYHFDKDVFKSSEITDFLNENNQNDVWLYKRIKHS